jgi:hypothetical protein
MSDGTNVDTTQEPGWAPPLLSGFSVNRRNYGHWDIWNASGRIFAIRGGPGDYWLRDERNMRKDSGTAKEWPHFKTLGMLMAYVCEELMYEHLTVEGKEPHAIEPWNV